MSEKQICSFCGHTTRNTNGVCWDCSRKAWCENCGKIRSSRRKECPSCSRLVCVYCQAPQGYFCSHGNVPAISLEDVEDETNIVAYKEYCSHFIR